MKRREFVKQSSALAAGGMMLSYGASAGLKASEPVRKGLQDIGVQLYSLRNELPNDREGVLKKISEIGYKYLETYLMEGKPHLGFPIADYKKMLDDLGLQVMSAHIPTGRSNPELEGTLTNNFDKVIEDANFLGQKYIVCPWLDEKYRQSLDDYKKNIDLLNACGEKCKAAGITFAYHNHAFEFEELEGKIPMEVMIESTDPDLVQIELDIFWSTKAGRDAIELFNQYPNRFALWHVKDMSETNPDETVYVGGGSIDYEKVFRNAENSGMKYFFVELEHYSIPAIEGIQKSFDTLKAMKV